MFNWKTTAAGVATIAVAALETFLGIDVPGFNLDLGSAVVAASGLIFAADALKR